MFETFDIDSETKFKILVQIVQIQGVPNRRDVRELRLSPKRWEAQSELGRCYQYKFNYGDRKEVNRHMAENRF
jgi:hypothetical protein